MQNDIPLPLSLVYGFKSNRLILFNPWFQIDAIRQVYTNIETELRKNRDKAKDDITKYLDEEAGVKMDKLQTELLLFDAKLKDVHMVSIYYNSRKLS